MPPEPSHAEVIKTAILHLRAVAAEKKSNIVEMRKHLSWYTKGMHGSAELRNRINVAQTAQEMEDLLESLLTKVGSVSTQRR